MNISLRRVCPVCGNKISLVSVVLPGIKGGDEKVYCRHCGSYISESMRRYNWIGMLGILVGIVVGKISSCLGITCGIWCVVSSSLLFVIVFVLAVYYLIPLKR